MVEMAPPDVAGALAAQRHRRVSRWASRIPSQAEMGGFGRVLFHAREYWPDYMSCVLVVRQDVIDQRPEAVQTAGRRHRALRPVARGGQALSRARRRFRRPLLLQPEPGAAALGADQAARPRDVHAARAAQAGLRAGARSDDRDRRTRPKKSNSNSTPIFGSPTRRVSKPPGTTNPEPRKRNRGHPWTDEASFAALRRRGDGRTNYRQAAAGNRRKSSTR